MTLVIGITGGIASGKSTLTKRLKNNTKQPRQIHNRSENKINIQKILQQLTMTKRF